MKQTHTVTIDNVKYTSIRRAALAHDVTPQLIGRRMKFYGRESLSSAELLEVPTKTVKPSMTWDFVYDQITSSPKNRGVHSQPVAH